MTPKYFTLVLVLFACFSTRSYAITGNEYRELSDTERIVWIIGVTDGLSTAELYAANKQPAIDKCIEGLEWVQVKAIFEKALNSDPERWHFPAAFAFRQTFYKYCRISE